MNVSSDCGPFFVGVDLGGTNIKVGLVDNSAHSLSRVSVPTETERGPDVGLANICRAITAAVQQSPIPMSGVRAIGLATPGPMDIPAGLIFNPTNLPGWDNLPIRQRITEHFGLPTILQNDANAAAYGEFWAGAGQQAGSLVLWTMGTGIGCGIIIGDVIIEGAHSHGAECGHIIIEMDNGRLCDTGQYGTLEAYAGAKSLVRRCEEALHTDRKSTIRERLADGEELTPLLIAQLAEAGDELADELVMQTARFMGIGTTTLMHTIDPDMVLIGGAMTFGRYDTKLGRRFLEEIRNEVNKRAFPIPAAKTKIEYAGLGGDAGYIGAAGCARLKYP